MYLVVTKALVVLGVVEVVVGGRRRRRRRRRCAVPDRSRLGDIKDTSLLWTLKNNNKTRICVPGYGPCRTPEEPPSVPDEGAPLTRGVGVRV